MNDSYLCIDIGTNSIKALEKDSDGRVLRWGVLERKRDFHSSIRPIDPEDAAKALAELLKKMGSGGRPAVFSLPAFYLFTAASELVDPRLVPALPSVYKISAWPLKDGRYFFEAIPLEIVERYKQICRAAGLEFSGAISESEAIAVSAPEYSGKTLVVDVDERVTTFTLVNGGVVEYIYHNDFGRASESLDVIMNKTREIAGKTGAEKVYFSNSTFNIANGLPKISQQAFNGYRFGGRFRPAY